MNTTLFRNIFALAPAAATAMRNGDAGQAGMATAGDAVASEAVRQSGAAVLACAIAFMATLDEAQRGNLVHAYTFANAARWHTFPQPSLGRRQARLGLRLGDLSETQRQGAMALLAAATGGARNEGFDAILQHLAVDDWIAENGGGSDYGAGNFYLAFIGAPADTGIWQLQFGGHHLALNHTYRDGVLAGATPSFRAAEPHRPFYYRGAALRPQRDQWEAFVRLLASLEPKRLAAATLHRRQDVLLLGPEVRRKDWNFPSRPEGVAAWSLSAPQRVLLLDAISLYVNDVAAADAAGIMARYKRELNETRLGFSGSKALEHTGDYVRIDGPSVWIELVMDPPHSTDQPHVHAVWRDKRTDYAGTGRPAGGADPDELFRNFL